MAGLLLILLPPLLALLTELLLALLYPPLGLLPGLLPLLQLLWTQLLL